MGTPTSQNTRTLTAYVASLLEYPRWMIERDVDFTDCSHGGKYDCDVAACVICRFGSACLWLNRHRTPSTMGAPLDELIGALRGAVHYTQSTITHEHGCHCETCAWLRDARRFLKHGAF